MWSGVTSESCNQAVFWLKPSIASGASLRLSLSLSLSKLRHRALARSSSVAGKLALRTPQPGTGHSVGRIECPRPPRGKTNAFTCVAPLAVAVLFCLCAQPASAQGQPWFELTYAYSGTTTTSATDPRYSSTSADWAAGGNIQQLPLPPGVSCAAPYAITATLAGTETVSGLWTLDGHTMAPNPPAKAYFLVQVEAACPRTPGAQVTSQSANDGYNDPDMTRDSKGAHILTVVVNPTTGTFSHDFGLSAAITATIPLPGGSGPRNSPGNSTEAVGVTASLLISPQSPTASNFDFSGYPNPPPYGTTPFAATTKAAEQAVGYSAAAATNANAAAALAALKKDAVVYIFGHGGVQFESCQTFWDGIGTWGAMVQAPGARTTLVQQGMNAANIVVLDDTDANGKVILPADAFHQVRLVMFEGCFTSFWTASWGDPADGAIAHGAKAAIGWRAEIYTDGQNCPGAETWATTFWSTACTPGKLISDAVSKADHACTCLDSHVREHDVKGASGTYLAPAQFGD